MNFMRLFIWGWLVAFPVGMFVLVTGVVLIDDVIAVSAKEGLGRWMPFVYTVGSSIAGGGVFFLLMRGAPPLPDRVRKWVKRRAPRSVTLRK